MFLEIKKIPIPLLIISNKQRDEDFRVTTLIHIDLTANISTVRMIPGSISAAFPFIQR